MSLLPNSIKHGLRGMYRNRDLLRSLVKREIEVRYRGSALGKLWVVVYPLVMLAVYTFVFGGVFGSRWAGSGDLTVFVPMLYCGLIVHAIFAETVSKSPSQIVNNANYVKKVIFPLVLLPIASLFTALFNATISFALLILMVLLFKQELHWTVVFVPLVLLPLVLLTIGVAWMTAALGVFLRDVEQFMGILMSMLLFLSPVFYSTESAPPFARKLLMLNPLSYPIEEIRNVIVLGVVPNLSAWVFSLVPAIAVALIGLWVFESARPAFADVI